MSHQSDAGQRRRSPSGEPPVQQSFFELIPSGTNIDFVGRWKFFAGLSIFVILFCAAMVPVRGIRLGVDFAGGHRVVVKTTDADEARLRSALIDLGISDPGVTRIGAVADGMFETRFPAQDQLPKEGLGAFMEQKLGAALGSVKVESVDYVGPRVGAELRRGAVISLGLAFLMILIYVGVRFAPVYAPGGVIALVHDVLITAGIFVLLGWEFDLNVIAALLTIIGYSLNDTIVIYDRIRENRARYASASMAEVVNRSVNETLSRTILTSGLTMLAILALLFLGGRELRGFSAAMTIGIIVGCYSTVYVASPLMIWVDRKFNQAAEARSAKRRGEARAR